MMTSRFIRFAVVCTLVVGMLPAILAQDTVTIPKARFEELERKEKELERLKGETVKLKQEKDAAVAKAAAVVAAAPSETQVTHVAPPMNTLPPLGKGGTVDSMDLASHYRTDPATADTRYRKQVFKVKGEIVGFEKPMLTRNYHVLLRAPDRQMRVLCSVATPEEYVSVFTTQGGTCLTGSLGNNVRVPMAKIGQIATLEGRCKGMNGSLVEMDGCRLVLAE